MVCRPAGPEPGGIEVEPAPTLVLPTAGTFRLHRGRNHTWLADPTQVILLPGGACHRYSHPHAGGDCTLAVEVRESAVPAFLEGCDPAAAEGTPTGIHRAFLPPAELVARARLERSLRRGGTDPLAVEERLTRWLALVLAARPPAARRADTARRNAERVEAVQLLLAADPARRWGLLELGRLAATAPLHLTTVFRQHTGLPIHRYLLRLRLERALVQVLDSRRELTHVALDLGFATPSHFTSTFRRTFGVTPSALRRNGEGFRQRPRPAAAIVRP